MSDQRHLDAAPRTQRNLGDAIDVSPEVIDINAARVRNHRAGLKSCATNVGPAKAGHYVLMRQAGDGDVLRRGEWIPRNT